MTAIINVNEGRVEAGMRKWIKLNRTLKTSEGLMSAGKPFRSQFADNLVKRGLAKYCDPPVKPAARKAPGPEKPKVVEKPKPKPKPVQVKKPQWKLKMKPDRYLKLHPKGQHAALARELTKG